MPENFALIAVLYDSMRVLNSVQPVGNPSIDSRTGN